MGNISAHRYIGEVIKPVNALKQLGSIDSGDTGAETAQVGLAINRISGHGPRFESVDIAIAIWVEQDSGRSMVINSKLQNRETTSGAGSTWADFGATGETLTLQNTSTETGVQLNEVLRYTRNLNGADKWIRVVVTPVPGATATGDQLMLAALAILAGADKVPTT